MGEAQPSVLLVYWPLRKEGDCATLPSELWQMKQSGNASFPELPFFFLKKDFLLKRTVLQ